ncbi:MAG: agmatine/peptidylarginine deiminase [Ignavibacteriaceae bacterium]
MNERRLPAEWERHRATLISLPHNKEDWPGKFQPIPWVYVEIVRKLTPGEMVYVIIHSKQAEYKFRKMLSKAGVNLKRVKFFKFQTNRSWMRDTSPAFIKKVVEKGEEVSAVRFNFNAWAKYSNWKKDVKIPVLMTSRIKMAMEEALYNSRSVVLEGGAIDKNGSGTLMTTEECLMDAKTQVRNPGFKKDDYEAVFKNFLGIKKVIWLNKGIAGDDTHGHVDDLARFVNRNTIVLCREDDVNDENYKILEENYERLQNESAENGEKINIVFLPMPSPIIFEGMRLPASYANFYIGNEVVLVPTFNDKNDRIALGIISELFPEREVVGIHAVDLVWGLGTIHCLSHEIPE